MTEQRWQPGETVIFRYPLWDRMVRAYLATHEDTVVNVYGWPMVVVKDTPELTALYQPSGTTTSRWDVEGARFREPRANRSHCLRLFYPGKPYEISLYYDAGGGRDPWIDAFFPEQTGPFYGWKIDLVSPHARTAAGIDTFDEVLDIIVNPDRTYYWKDEDEMAILIQRGIYTEAEAHVIRDSAREAIDLIEAGAPPFDDEWPSWRAPEGIVPSDPPEGWQLLPVPAPYKTYDGPLT